MFRGRPALGEMYETGLETETKGGASVCCCSFRLQAVEVKKEEE